MSNSYSPDIFGNENSNDKENYETDESRKKKRKIVTMEKIKGQVLRSKKIKSAI